MRVGQRAKCSGSIALVLVASVVGLLVVFALASSSLTQLRLTTHQANADQARNAAESVVQTAIAKLMVDKNFGLPGRGTPMQLPVLCGQAQGYITFEHTSDDEGLPLSLNNVDSDTPIQGWGRMLPAETVQLIGIGTCNGVERRVEAIVAVPRFPAVISSSGDLHVTGGMVVGVLPLGADISTVGADDLLPGDLVSNSKNDAAVKLNSYVTVYGDVISGGGVSDEDADVRGETRKNATEQILPRIKISDYNPVGRTDIHVPSQLSSRLGPPGPPAALSGWNYRQGDLDVEGDLQLDAGILYVSGDLTVSGSVTGRGALMVEKSISIRQSVDLESNDQVALVAGEDVSLFGGGKFRGMVYTEGNFSGDDVQLFGGFVANAKATTPEKGNIRLSEVGMVALDPSMAFDKSWLSYSVTRARVAALDLPLAQRPTSTLESHFVEVNSDGEIVVESDIYTNFPGGNGQLPAPKLEGQYREFYDSEGTRVRVETRRSPDQEWAVPPEGATLARAVRYDNQSGLGSSKDYISFELPPPHPPKAVKVYKDVANFSLDFSQFLKLEDQMRILLWIEH